LDTLSIITSIEASHATVTIDLGDYDETYKGAVFDVWVTPTRAHVQAYQAYYTKWVAPVVEAGKVPPEVADRDDERTAELDPWLAETWRNIPLEQVTAIREHLQATNPRAWDWLYNKTLETAAQYRETLVKN
jgi:hypothetical protein